MRRLRLWPAATLGGFIFLARTAHAETSGPELMPRFTLIELDYPQGVAASVGEWVLRAAGGGAELGLVGDAELGLSGPKVALGVGATSSRTANVDKVYSFGIQAVAHRTWPWWSPFLPTSATYAGVEAFGDFFMFRCSVGVMWQVAGSAAASSPIPSAGCGIGLP